MEGLVGEEDSSLIYLAHGGNELGQTKVLDIQHSQVTLGFKGELKVIVYLIDPCQWLQEARVWDGGKRKLSGRLEFSCRLGL